ncbi:MAG: hypothetical protein AAGI46_14980 [Planctomycetota bacterium]
MIRLAALFVAFLAPAVANATAYLEAAGELAAKTELAAADHEQRDDFLYVAASIRAAIGDEEGAVRIAEMLPATSVLRSKALAEAGRIDDAFALLAAMPEAAREDVDEATLLDNALIAAITLGDNEQAEELLDRLTTVQDPDAIVSDVAYRIVLGDDTAKPERDMAAFEYSFAAQLLLLRGERERADDYIGQAKAHAVMTGGASFDLEPIGWFYSLAGDAASVDQFLAILEDQSDDSVGMLLLHRARLDLLAGDEEAFERRLKEAATHFEDADDSIDVFAFQAGYAESVDLERVEAVLADVGVHDDQYLAGLGLGLWETHLIENQSEDEAE